MVTTNERDFGAAAFCGPRLSFYVAGVGSGNLFVWTSGDGVVWGDAMDTRSRSRVGNGVVLGGFRGDRAHW